jgi:hypothetical protein
MKAWLCCASVAAALALLPASAPAVVKTIPTVAASPAADTTAASPTGGAAAPAASTPAATTAAATTPATSTPAAPATTTLTPSSAGTPAATVTVTKTPAKSGGVSGWAILAAALGALLVLACAVWAVFRWGAYEPHWLASARHSVSEAGYRVSETWAELTDWARLGH